MRAILALLAMTGYASAADVSLEYENFYLDKGRAKIILKIENNTARRYKMVFAECAFLDGNQRAIDTATLIASNVSAGAVAYVDGWSAQIDGIKHASCRISDTM